MQKQRRLAVAVTVLAAIGVSTGVALAADSGGSTPGLVAPNTNLAPVALPQPTFGPSNEPTPLFNPKTQPAPAAGPVPASLPAPVSPGTTVVLQGVIPMTQAPFDTSTFPVTDAYRGTVNGASELVYAGQDLSQGGVAAIRVFNESSPGNPVSEKGEYVLSSTPAAADITQGSGPTMNIALPATASGTTAQPAAVGQALQGAPTVTFSLSSDSIVSS
jgi:hypothetical protein